MCVLLVGIKKLTVAPAGSWLLISGTAVLLVLLAAYFYSRPRGDFRSGRRRLLVLLRSLAFLCLVLALLQPSISLESRESRQPRILVLLDGSASMNLPYQLGPGADSTRTRSDVAIQFAGALASRLPARFDKQLFVFSDTLRHIDERAVGSAARELSGVSGAPRSALGLALEVASSKVGTAPGAVVLISDGASSYGPDPSRVARRISLPVYTVAAAVEGRFRDIEVSEVLYPPTGFVGTEIPVLLRVKGYGLENLDVPVSISERDNVLSRGVLRLAGSAQAELVLSVRPGTAGVHFYKVSLPVVRGEASNVNNATRFAVKAVSEKLGVLYLEGDLTWDFTFLKRELESDPRLDVMFALVSGWKTGLPGVRGIVSLTPGTLQRSSVVVVGDGAAKRIDAETWRAIEQFVVSGGGLLFAGVDGLDQVPAYVKDLIPAAMVRPERRGAQDFVDVFITADGLSHPVCQVEKDPTLNRQSWQDVSPLMGARALENPKPGASVLLEGRLNGDEKEFPVLVAGNAGKGRVLLVGAGGLWRWGFTLPGMGGSTRLFRSLVFNAVSWLAEGNQENRVDIGPRKWVFEEGEDVRFTARGIENPSGVQLELTGSPGQKYTARGSRSGDAGELEFDFGVLRHDTYSYTGSCSSEGSVLNFRGEFMVDTVGAEDRNLFPDPGLLSYISQASGGKFFSANEVDNLVREIQTFGERVVVERQIRLWNHPALLVLFIFFLAFEWWLRKRSGLP